MSDHREPRLHSLVTLTVAILVLSVGGLATAAEWEFGVRFPKEVHAEPFTGRAYLFFSKSEFGEPRFGPDWFNPEPFMAMDVQNWRPGDGLVFSAENAERLLTFPKTLPKKSLAGYRAQALVRFNPHDRRVGKGVGNGYSEVVQVPATGDHRPLLVVDQLVPEQEFPETKWSRLLKVRSDLLSDFHGRDVFMKAAVIPSASYYENPDRRYPTIFHIPGFGGTHFRGATNEPVPEDNRKNVEFLRVILDPSCPLGHHVFADSANNGPYGTALVKELVPAFDKRFRSIAEPSARFLTGHSSGGWSSLWVQIQHPEFFAGTWSTAPDPVDFRDFQRIDLYEPGQNMYVDSDGEKRPLARRNGKVVVWYEDFAWMEWVRGHGGQLHSFEAVFSARGENGKPQLLFDRRTGAVDHAVAETWKKYDIRRVLENNWQTLGPKLAGKLHVYMGGKDTFYLEGATRLLKKTLERLGSDAVVEFYPEKNHFDVLTSKLRDRIRGDMVETFLRANPDYPETQ